MINLMTMDEIARTACLTVVVGTPMGIGFWLAWFAYKNHIKDLQNHVKDLKETLFVLMPKNNGTDT